MADLANLEIRVDSSGIAETTKELGRLEAGAENAAGAVDALESSAQSAGPTVRTVGEAAQEGAQSTSKLDDSASKAATALDRLADKAQATEASFREVTTATMESVRATQFAATAIANATRALELMGRGSQRATAGQQAAAEAAGLVGAAIAGAAGAQEGAARATDEAGEATNRTTRRLRDHADAVRAVRVDWTNLGYQMQDVFVTLAMGMNPLMVLIQQGGQIYGALGNSPGGVATAFAQIGERALGLLTPLRLATAAMLIIPTTLFAALQSARSANEETNRSLVASGRAYGITVQQINAVSMAAANSGKISVGAARQSAIAFATTGKVSAESLGGAVDAADKYARLIGKELPEASATLAQAFKDPARGIQTLNQQMNLTDAATEDLIATMADTGRGGEAVAKIIQLIGERSAEADQKITRLRAAMNFITGNIGRNWERLGQGLEHLINPTAMDELRTATGRMLYLQTLVDRFSKSGATGPLGAAQADLDAQQKLVEALQKQVDAEKARNDEIARGHRSDAASIEATNLTKQLQTGGDVMSEMVAQLHTLAEGLKEADKLADAKGTQQVFEATRTALNDYLIAGSAAELQTRKLAESNNLQIQATQALTIGEQARLAGMISLNEALGTRTTEEQRLAAAEAASAMVIAQWNAQIGQQTFAVQNEIAVRQQMNDAVARGLMSSTEMQQSLQQEIQLQALMQQALSLTGAAQEEAVNNVNRLRDAYQQLAAEQKRGQLVSNIQQNYDQIAVLKLEADMIWRGRGERNEAIAVMKAEQQIRRQGIDINSAEAASYIESARALAEQNEQTTLAHEKRTRMQDLFNANWRALHKETQEYRMSAQAIADWNKRAQDAEETRQRMQSFKSGVGINSPTVGGGTGSGMSFSVLRPGEAEQATQQFGQGGFETQAYGNWRRGFGANIVPNAQGIAFQQQARFETSGLGDIEAQFATAIQNLEEIANQGDLVRPTAPDARPGLAVATAPGAYGADKNASFFYDAASRQTFMESMGLGNVDRSSPEQKAYEQSLKEYEEQKKIRDATGLTAERAREQIQLLTESLDAARAYYASSQKEPEAIAASLQAVLSQVPGAAAQPVAESFGAIQQAANQNTVSGGTGSPTGTVGVLRFAQGGSFKVGGNPGRDANRVALDLTRGERVTVKKSSAVSERPIEVNMTIVTPDVNSFKESRSSVEARARKMIANASRS